MGAQGSSKRGDVKQWVDDADYKYDDSQRKRKSRCCGTQQQFDCSNEQENDVEITPCGDPASVDEDLLTDLVPSQSRWCMQNPIGKRHRLEDSKFAAGEPRVRYLSGSDSEREEGHGGFKDHWVDPLTVAEQWTIYVVDEIHDDEEEWLVWNNEKVGGVIRRYKEEYQQAIELQIVTRSRWGNEVHISLSPERTWKEQVKNKIRVLKKFTLAKKPARFKALANGSSLHRTTSLQQFGSQNVMIKRNYSVGALPSVNTSSDSERVRSLNTAESEVSFKRDSRKETLRLTNRLPTGCAGSRAVSEDHVLFKRNFSGKNEQPNINVRSRALTLPKDHNFFRRDLRANESELNGGVRQSTDKNLLLNSCHSFDAANNSVRQCQNPFKSPRHSERIISARSFGIYEETSQFSSMGRYDVQAVPAMPVALSAASR
mmetsp:Transcript_2400/g.3477  ORF Transcript_2400/g.3477 Transcript_2400/m.3477 type:complete len:429 (+) Transcript_2400:51-1337(+)|eukprot:CAMPEP_0184494354 /NCGR_PEP_ID=MMETSP0113_2-20130426/28503_1 /TAXON_ID=91329 /ORGANISM="Norrisiella sphaerica, Strain BC52" /LENGTH=428 /DNA_ID=CAMNT_0026880081 /DNA_START=13 /DNA_END=1299 /DNA_ORIENTATION=+